MWVKVLKRNTTQVTESQGKCQVTKQTTTFHPLKINNTFSVAITRQLKSKEYIKEY
jgi:glycine betaine/choline ABC-type transport system substrate-binding protein